MTQRERLEAKFREAAERLGLDTAELLRRHAESGKYVNARVEEGFGRRDRWDTVTHGGKPVRVLDWNQLSERGLIVRINTEILHPLGLAMFRDPETGQSGGAVMSEDGEPFCYPPEPDQ